VASLLDGLARISSAGPCTSPCMGAHITSSMARVTINALVLLSEWDAELGGVELFCS
jgi:hypothetical protein